MAWHAPFDGVLLRVRPDNKPMLRRMLRHLRSVGALPKTARLMEYGDEYVALNVCRADAERLVTACGWTVTDAHPVPAASGED